MKNEKYINTDLKSDLDRLQLLLINFDLPLDKKNLYTEDKQIDYKNLIWLNSNLTIQNKRNIKLHETLRLIQKIIKNTK